MENVELFDEVINKIDDNYLFLGQQKDIWIKYVKSMRKNIESVENIYDYLNDIILILKDSHTNLFVNNNQKEIFDLDFTWINNKIIIKPNILGYSNEILDGELIELNSEPISIIVSKFKSKFKHFPQCIVQDEITKYINSNLKLDFQTIKVIKNNDIYIEKIKLIDSKDSNEIIEKRLKNIRSKFSPALITEIDQDTLLIKILTFNERDIDRYILNKYDLIKRKKRILFDVRNNKGGLISETKKIVSLIINHDIELDYNIVSRDGIEHNLNKITTQHNNLFSNKEVIIVCNEYSMSSTEFIFIKGLKAGHDNVKVIGNITAGVSGQAKIFNLNSSTAILQVTVKKYLDKSNRELVRGYIPDKIIDLSKDNYIKYIDNKIKLLSLY